MSTITRLATLGLLSTLTGCAFLSGLFNKPGSSSSAAVGSYTDKVATSGAATDSKTAAAATVIKETADTLPDSTSKTVITKEAGVITSGTGSATPADLKEARARAAAIVAGKPEADEAYNKAEDARMAERANHLNEIASLKDAAKKAEQDKADAIKQARLDKQSGMWTVLGIGMFAVGLAGAVASIYFRFSPVGPILLVVGGILSSITGRLLDSDIFVFSLGAVIIATVLGVIWFFVSGFLKARKTSAELLETEAELKLHQDTTAMIVSGIDKTIFSAPGVGQEFKDHVKQALRGPMGQEHKDIVIAGRAKAVEMKLDKS